MYLLYLLCKALKTFCARCLQSSSQGKESSEAISNTASPPHPIHATDVDTSCTPADLQPVVVALLNLFRQCQLVAPPAKKREMEDNSKRLANLLWSLNRGDVSKGLSARLKMLQCALDAWDLYAANVLLLQMTSSDWDECSHWLTAIKRLIKLAQMP